VTILVALVILVFWFGVYPHSLNRLIEGAAEGLITWGMN
jgi:NADH:ubiquinone oxidoreductase subunit 4 (subunit M)